MADWHMSIEDRQNMKSRLEDYEEQIGRLRMADWQIEIVIRAAEHLTDWQIVNSRLAETQILC